MSLEKTGKVRPREISCPCYFPQRNSSLKIRIYRVDHESDSRIANRAFRDDGVLRIVLFCRFSICPIATFCYTHPPSFEALRRAEDTQVLMHAAVRMGRVGSSSRVTARPAIMSDLYYWRMVQARVGGARGPMHIRTRLRTLISLRAIVALAVAGIGIVDL